LRFDAALVHGNPRLGIGRVFERPDLGRVSIWDAHLDGESPLFIRHKVIGRFGMWMCVGWRHDSLTFGSRHSQQPLIAIVSVAEMTHPVPPSSSSL
jgi:hypothetical protein